MLKLAKTIALLLSAFLGASCVFAAEDIGAIDREAVKQRLEATIVDEAYLAAKKDRGVNPTLGSKIVRRTLAEYETENPTTHKIVLFSGHKGMHSRVYGTGQSSMFYMVDECWDEVNPDLVLNIQEYNNLYYFPDNWADLIAADDARFLEDEDIRHFIRILKPNGNLVFKPGFGMGWVTSDFFKTGGLDSADILESGRAAKVPQTVWGRLMSPQGKNDYQRLQDKMLAKAKEFYETMGVNFSYDKTDNCFVLTKK